MKSRVICVALALLLAGRFASAQWVQTNGPYGGDVRCFAMVPSGDGGGKPTIYVGTYCGGVFRSTDGGSTWVAVNNGLTHPAINALAVTPGAGGPGTAYIFAGTCGGVFRSSDGGESWVETSSGLINPETRSLAVTYADDGTGLVRLFAGTAGNGIFVSTDNGATWTSAGVTTACITSLVGQGTTLIAGEPRVGGGGG